MMNYACSFSECKNWCNYTCECDNTGKGFCEDHLSLHISTEGKHDIKKNFFSLTIDEKEVFAAQLEVSLKKLDSIREKMSKKSKEIIEKTIEKTKESLDCIRKKQSLIFKVLEFLRQNDRIRTKSRQTKVKNFIFNYAKNPNDYYDKLLVEESEIIETLDLEKKKENLGKKEEDLNIRTFDFNKKFKKSNKKLKRIKASVKYLNEQYELIKKSILSEISMTVYNLEKLNLSYEFTNPLKKNINSSDNPGIIYSEIVDNLKKLTDQIILKSFNLGEDFSKLQKYIDDD
ncbi:hypothetical protein SteCoe_16872 [Stentor coeruleus]|uniref:Uncharacterized protein n=1 Tax=Stentor coeruleus TaxID=5963 RepID=A0A1R2C0C0_9CILI|nr:hypothetical protein SteCoe_16872 [Stentor coeruleus]